MRRVPDGGDKLPLGRLKRRADFLTVAGGGRKAVAPGLILQARARDPAGELEQLEMRVGFTASRKVGIAVARNRARRRLRALAQELLPAQGLPGHDYVLIARPETIERPFALLRDDLTRALGRLARKAPPA